MSIINIETEFFESSNAKKVFIWLFATWLVISILFAVFLIQTHKFANQDKLNAESAIALRIISQRVDQHDAHLTNLSALAQVLNGENTELFFQVADAIQLFYPRISNIDLVPFPGEPLSLSTRDIELDNTKIDQVIRSTAQASTGGFIVKRSPISSNHYLLVKRSPNNSRARFGLSLEIDLNQLIQVDQQFWRAVENTLSLSLPNGESLVNGNIAREFESDSLISYQATLGSLFQPFLLSSRSALGFKEQYPIDKISIASLIFATLLLVSYMGFNFISRVRSAEKRARLSEQDALIAHASRVNVLGEMASGMAHELTQPLTSILSHSQAGLHLVKAKPLDLSAVKAIFETNVIQSKRAADIITRLRNWTRRSEIKYANQNLNDCITNVLLLTDSDAQRLGIDIDFSFDAVSPPVWGDSIEIEQVIFNLVKNSLEGIEMSQTSIDSPLIRVVITNNEKNVELTVVDNGPGLTKEIEDRLFEPFVTSKANGTGLGLALCVRIIERMNGQIHIRNNDTAGITATVLFPASEPQATTNV